MTASKLTAPLATKPKDVTAASASGVIRWFFTFIVSFIATVFSELRLIFSNHSTGSMARRIVRESPAASAAESIALAAHGQNVPG